MRCHGIAPYRCHDRVADTSVATWLACQDSVSESLRALIRESIERDGYLDLANRPLAQQPRKGRPPAEPAGTAPVVQAAPIPVVDGSQDAEETDEIESPAASTSSPAPSRPDPDAESDDVERPPATDGDDQVSDIGISEAGKQFSVDDINELLRSSRQ